MIVKDDVSQKQTVKWWICVKNKMQSQWRWRVRVGLVDEF